MDQILLGRLFLDLFEWFRSVQVEDDMQTLPQK